MLSVLLFWEINRINIPIIRYRLDYFSLFYVIDYYLLG